MKEVLERKHVTGTERAVWPVLEAGGRVIWMKGMELEPEPGLAITLIEATTEGSEVMPLTRSK